MRRSFKPIPIEPLLPAVVATNSSLPQTASASGRLGRTVLTRALRLHRADYRLPACAVHGATGVPGRPLRDAGFRAVDVGSGSGSVGRPGQKQSFPYRAAGSLARATGQRGAAVIRAAAPRTTGSGPCRRSAAEADRPHPVFRAQSRDSPSSLRREASIRANCYSRASLITAPNTSTATSPLPQRHVVNR